MIIKPEPQRVAIPFYRSIILSLFIIFLTIRGDIFSGITDSININPFLIIITLRVIGSAIIFVLVYSWGYNLSHLGLSKYKFRKGIRHAIIWSLGFGLIVAIMAGIMFLYGINPLSLFSYNGNRGFGYMIIYYLVVCIFGPMVEDLTFIGLLYNSIRTKLNLYISILILATLFAICHVSFYPASLKQISPFLIIQFIGGLLFSTSFEFSESLLTPMIIHICGNLVITTLSLL